MKSIHKTVLLHETIDGLNLKDGSKVLDATFGGGGHSLEVCHRYPASKLLVIDQDKGAWDRAKDKFEDGKCDIKFFNLNFRNLDQVGEKVDGIIFDLGLSSDQLEHSLRGFSFMKDEPLLMTMKEDPRQEDTSGLDVVNSWSEESLADIIAGFGEEKYARLIAKRIVEARKEKKIESTLQLVDIIASAVPDRYRKGKIHFATRTFQAIRIAVNDELVALSEGLAKAYDALNPSGRIAVISFHSLEDRIVKRYFKELEKEGKGKVVTKKPIVPSEEELKENRRARSAKLRIIEKI